MESKTCFERQRHENHKNMLIKFKNDITYHCNDILSEHTKLSNKVFCDPVTVKLKSENHF